MTVASRPVRGMTRLFGRRYSLIGADLFLIDNDVRMAVAKAG
jgi:hypothetical protein